MALKRSKLDPLSSECYPIFGFRRQSFRSCADKSAQLRLFPLIGTQPIRNECIKGNRLRIMDTDPVICPSIIFSDLTVRESGTDKLSLIGCFTQFNAAHFPFVAAPFHVTVLLTNVQGPAEALPITMRIEEPGSGHVIASMSGSAKILANHSREDIAQIVFGFAPTQYPAPGKYDVVVLVKNEVINRRALFIKPISSSTTAGKFESQ